MRRVLALSALIVCVSPAWTRADTTADCVLPDAPGASHATAGVTALLRSFFMAKSRGDVEGTMSYFSKDGVIYNDVIVGWSFPSWASLHDAYAQIMPTWPKTARSYPLRIMGGAGGAVIIMHDTKELFGEDLYGIAAVTLRHSKIVRWADYWDGRQMSPGLRAKMLRPLPTDFRDDAGGADAAPAIRRVSIALQAAFSNGDIDAVMGRFSDDAVVEDLALRAQLIGLSRIRHYFEIGLKSLPYGSGAALVNIVGGTAGGGYEWRAPAGSGVGRGITALELNVAGKITRLTTVYDTVPLSDERFKSLVLLAGG